MAVYGNYLFSAAGYNGLSVSDITSPASPRFLGYTRTNGLAVDVAVSGRYAYVATTTYPASMDNTGTSEAFTGLTVFDISDPISPSITGSTEIPDGTRCVAVQGDYAYVVGYRGFYVIDISSSSSPTIVEFVDTPENDLTLFSIVDQCIYAVDYLQFRVVDISDPLSPSYAGSINTSFYRSHMAISGQYAYIIGRGGLQVLNVRFPGFPRIVKSVDLEGQPSGIAISGNYAVVTDNWVGIQLIDISSPESPVITGFYDVSLSYGIIASGNYIYMNGPAGLQVLTIADPASYPETGL